MKKLVFMLIIGMYAGVFAQFKDSGFPKESIKDGVVDQSSSNNLLGFLNTENFHMRHQYNLSYSSFGNHGLALGVYTNSMFYNFTNNLNVQADISLVHSPYSSFGKDFQNDLNGIYLSRAAINYMPWKDFSITFQYRNIPMNYYPGFYESSMFNRIGYYDPFYGY